MSEYRAQKRRAVIRVESEGMQDYVRKKIAYEDLSPRKVEEIGFVPRWATLEEPYICATVEAVKRASDSIRLWR